MELNPNARPNPTPITLAAAFEPVESDPTRVLGYVICNRCGARWSGPFSANGGEPIATAELTEQVAAMLNADPEAINPKPLRTKLCCRRSGIPIPAPADKIRFATDPRPNAHRPGIERAENAVTAAAILPYGLWLGLKALGRAVLHWEFWAGALVLWYLSAQLAARSPGTASALVGLLLPALIIGMVIAAIVSWANSQGWIGRRRPKDHGKNLGGPTETSTYEHARAVQPVPGRGGEWPDRAGRL